MKLALVGDGKTGSHVRDLIPKEDLIGPYNEEYRLKDHLEEVKEADAIIVFTPGSVIPDILETLIKTKKPVICGSTGFTWPTDIDQRLKKENLRWIYASNFSLGMSIIRELLKVMSKVKHLLKNPSFNIEEIHHIHKKDAPSGTALTWEKWLSIPDIKIESKREGDVVGIHELTVETNSEQITIKHTAKNRSLFAEGALFAANEAINNQKLGYGLISFDIITSKLLKEELL